MKQKRTPLKPNGLREKYCGKAKITGTTLLDSRTRLAGRDGRPKFEVFGTSNLELRTSDRAPERQGERRVSGQTGCLGNLRAGGCSSCRGWAGEKRTFSAFC